MAIVKETVHRFTMLVGEVSGVEFGFEEHASQQKNGDIKGRFSDVEPLPYGVDIMALNSPGTGGETVMKFRDVQYRYEDDPAIDIAGISSVTVTLNDAKACNPASVSTTLDQTPGIGYFVTDPAFRAFLVANGGSTVYGTVAYTV